MVVADIAVQMQVPCTIYINNAAILLCITYFNVFTVGQWWFLSIFSIFTFFKVFM